MDDAADVREAAVELQMGRGVGGGFFVAFDGFAARQFDDDHVGGGHDVVFDAGGFDDNQAAFAVDAADVAPGEGDEAVARQVKVGGKDFVFQGF